MIRYVRWAAMKAASIRRDPGAHLSAFGIYYLALACFLLTLAVYYPGYMSFDSIYQLQGAREGVTDNWNPPMMAYVWRVLDRIVPGPGGMLIVNAGLFWFALARSPQPSRAPRDPRGGTHLLWVSTADFRLDRDYLERRGNAQLPTLTALAFSLHARNAAALGCWSGPPDSYGWRVPTATTCSLLPFP